MRKNKRENGIVKTAVFSAAVLLFTLFVAAPNAERISVFLRQNACVLLPGIRLSASQDGSPAAQEPEQPPADPVPADIRAQAELFRSEQASLTPAGSVTERHYTTQGATGLVGNIAVKNATASLQPDFTALLEEKPVFAPSAEDAPLVLIYHTHTTESYQRKDTGSYYTENVTRSEDPAVNVVRIGDAVCAVLESSGIACVHDTNIYDEQYAGAYARSRQSVQDLLAQYPSVQIALDVHRDSISDSATVAVKPTATIGGVKTAQVMILTGAQEGNVSDFPHWQKNLSFALCLQQKAQTMYPGLMRPLFFCPRRYNMDLVPCGLLLEVGSDANTLEEAYLAARLFAKALAALINENTEQT